MVFIMCNDVAVYWTDCGLDIKRAKKANCVVAFFALQYVL